MTDIKESHLHTSSSHLEMMPEIDDAPLAHAVEDTDPNNPQVGPRNPPFIMDATLKESLELVISSKTMHLFDHMLVYLPGKHKFE
jgi:hypothetical protein